MTRPRLGVADVVRAHGARFLAACGGRLTHEQTGALRDIERCRTAALGGHIEVYACGHEVIAYNSCRNRSCPKCLGHKAKEWVEKKECDLLPIPYFHVVFTLPKVLADVPPVARAALYEALFGAASKTLALVGREKLGGQLGFLAVLHTWGQTLTHHPHLHCVVAGGAFVKEGARFVTSGGRFFLPVRVLSLVFKAKMLDELQKRPPPGIEPSLLALLLADAGYKKWVVYAKRPFGGPAQVLRYLARYTHKVAISDRRILKVDDHGVVFSYRDYRHDQQLRAMRLQGSEWLGRFVDHVLPRGFTRLRSFGFLANTKKAHKLELIRAALSATVPTTRDRTEPQSPGICPLCGKGRLLGHRPLPPRPHDTS